jgi:hypothetical protein
MNAVDVVDLIIAGAVPSGGIAGITYWLKTRSSRKEAKAAKEAKDAERDKRNDEVYYFVAGRPKTELEPNPPPGLAAKVDALANQPDVVAHLAVKVDDLTAAVKSKDEALHTVVEKVGNLEVAVEQINAKASSVASGVAELVWDKGTNGGSTMRDAVDRLEIAVGSKPESSGSAEMRGESHSEQADQRDPETA